LRGFCQEILETVAGSCFREACTNRLKGTACEDKCPRENAIAACKVTITNNDGSEIIDWFYNVDTDPNSKIKSTDRIHTVDEVRKKCAEPGRYAWALCYEGGATFVAPSYASVARGLAVHKFLFPFKNVLFLLGSLRTWNCAMLTRMTQAPRHKMTLEEYLAWEDKQPGRNEFVGGEVFAMVGVKRVHGEVVMNISSALHFFLRGKPCRVYSESLKLNVGEDVFYPDIFVTCSPADLRTERLFKEPKLIVEVYSESTGSYDRGAKFAYYRGIATLEEYVIVEPDTHRVEVFRKQSDGVFGLHDYSRSPSAHFLSIDFEMALSEIFTNVEAISEA
jgi:Uma2 family endonuclease